MVIIYALICDATRKAYVGCTKGKPAKRMREHRCLLNQRKHSCSEMVQDWRQFGAGSFRLVVLESLLPDANVDQRRGKEKFWMEKYNQNALLYNTDMRSFELTPEQQRKGTEAVRHRPKRGIPLGHGAKISATKRARKAQQVMR